MLKDCKNRDLSMKPSQRQKGQSHLWVLMHLLVPVNKKQGRPCVIPEASQPSRWTALRLNNGKLQTPQTPLVYPITFQSWHSEQHCHKFLFFTVNACFKESHYSLQGGKNPQRFCLAGQYITSMFRKLLLGIDWAHRYSATVTYEEGTTTWPNTVGRDS